MLSFTRTVFIMINATADGPRSISCKPPTEVKILAVIEAFAGISYLLYILQYLGSMDPLMTVPVIMALLSFWIAYGLWKVKRPAWYLSFCFSAFGAIFGTVALLMMPITTESMLINASKPILDVLTILLLLSKDVRTEFGLIKKK